ncbi:MAG: hypothetical protein HY921_02290 [Elusimicrobia bacterium]|nr:hypothetical protein [Elusimicrobiota bacterium]
MPLSFLFVAAFAAAAQPEAACRKEFSLEKALARAPELAEYARLYLACRAFTLDNPNICEELAPLDRKASGRSPKPWPFPLVYSCKRDCYLWMFDRERITRGAQVLEACLRENSHRIPSDGGPFKAGTFRKACPIVARYFRSGGDPRAACSELLPYYRYAPDLEDCVGRLLYARGEDPAVCPRLLPPPFPRRCQDLATYHRAYDARDLKLCGESAYCRLLMGASPALCEPMLEDVKARFCAGVEQS